MQLSSMPFKMGPADRSLGHSSARDGFDPAIEGDPARAPRRQLATRAVGLSSAKRGVWRILAIVLGALVTSTD